MIRHALEGLSAVLVDHSMVERLCAAPFIILKKIRFAGSIWIWPVLDIVEEKVLSALCSCTGVAKAMVPHLTARNVERASRNWS